MKLVRTIAIAALTTTAAGAAVPGNPCAIGKQLVSQVLGAPISGMAPASTIGMKSCTFRAAGMVPYATIATSRRKSVAVAKALFQMQIASAAGNVIGKPLRVSGLGDEAAISDGFLYARRGTALYQFSIVERGPQLRDLPNVQRLAKAVLAAVKP